MLTPLEQGWPPSPGLQWVSLASTCLRPRRALLPPELCWAASTALLIADSIAAAHRSHRCPQPDPQQHKSSFPAAEGAIFMAWLNKEVFF